MSLTAAAEGAALMVGEAHHRFANGLQIIVSATNVILRSGGCDSQACERIQALQQQVASLAEVNRSLCGPYGPTSITEEALRRLCAGLAASFERTDAQLFVSVSGRAGEAETCRILLLLISELMMNAMKHGSRDARPLIVIDLVITSNWCRLEVRSNTAGRRSAVARPRFAAELAQSAGGTLDVVTDGDEYRVTAIVPSS